MIGTLSNCLASRSKCFAVAWVWTVCSGRVDASPVGGFDAGEGIRTVVARLEGPLELGGSQ